jgi:hypothetical protein
MCDSCREDRRAAANIVVTLSGYVITAALAVLGAQAVVTTFVLDKREHLTWFYVVPGVGAALLVLSIILGGKGIGEIVKSGAGGSWTTHTRYRKFNLQSICALAGTVLVVASAFLGDTKPSNPSNPPSRAGLPHDLTL